jgi:type I restriction enzyme R subunit
MPETPEDRARTTIDNLLEKAGWCVQDRDKANISAARGVIVRAFPLKKGHGFADYLLYVDGQAAGVVEAKKEGETLTTYEIQTAKYSEGLPDGLRAHRRRLPFCYQSTGVETRFTNLLDPDARSRQAFAFHSIQKLLRPLVLQQRLVKRLHQPIQGATHPRYPR